MSALLSEEDLNDFISPALECIKPTELLNAKQEAEANENGEIVVGKEQEENLQRVQITLSDCLACSGCVTSSEEVMLQRQSHTVFLERWKEEVMGLGRPLAVSISPQCRASLSIYWNIPIPEVDKRLCIEFKSRFRARYVIGTQLGRSLSLYHAHKETFRRAIHEKPLLTSACPGFVLYCEKNKRDLVPRLLRTQSPQQLTGQWLKYKDSNIYHLSIQPCFDKKLESARPENADTVDCTITVKELLALFELPYDGEIPTNESLENLLVSMNPWQDLDPNLSWSVNGEGGGNSGGYAYTYLQFLQTEILDSTEIITERGKNSDILIHKLVNTSQQAIAQTCEVSGFRNIQNLARKLSLSTNRHTVNTGRRGAAIRKRPKRLSSAESQLSKEVNIPSANGQNVGSIAVDFQQCDLVEVNACPGGCGQGNGLAPSDYSRIVSRIKFAEHYAKLPHIEGILLGARLAKRSVPTSEQVYKEVASTTSLLSSASAW